MIAKKLYNKNAKQLIIVSPIEFFVGWFCFFVSLWNNRIIFKGGFVSRFCSCESLRHYMWTKQLFPSCGQSIWIMLKKKEERHWNKSESQGTFIGQLKSSLLWCAILPSLAAKGKKLVTWNDQLYPKKNFSLRAGQFNNHEYILEPQTRGALFSWRWFLIMPKKIEKHWNRIIKSKC